MSAGHASEGKPMVRPIPRPGPRLQLAYRELDIAANGNDDQRRALHPVSDLPRPWSPATCKSAALRAELWEWLDAVVMWLNRELAFDTIDLIPACWPQHAHLVHELAVLADLRRRADLALTSDSLEEWHRYALPAFLERMRHRIAEHCNDHHPDVFPSSGRLTRHLNHVSVATRKRAFTGDLFASESASDTRLAGPVLRVVDTGTGEILG